MLHTAYQEWGAGRGGVHLGCTKPASLGSGGRDGEDTLPTGGQFICLPNAQQPQFQLPCLRGTQHSTGSTPSLTQTAV